MLFCIKNVSNYNIDAFFFQLVASRMLTFAKNKKEEVSCVLAKDITGGYNYRYIESWSGFEFRSAWPGGRTIPYSTLKESNRFRNYFSAVDE